MKTDYNHKMKHASKIQNWDAAEEIFNEVVSGAGLTDLSAEKEQTAYGARIAKALNQRDKGGRQI